MYILNLVGDYISETSGKAIVQDLYSNGLINHKEAKIIMAAISDKTLVIKQPEKDIVRAKMIKNILVNLI